MGANTSATEAAIEAVYRGQYASFVRLGYALLGSADLAREAVQETFVIGLRQRGSFRGQGSLEGWLWKTMVNVCRQEKRRRRRFSDEEPPEQVTNGHGSGTSSALRAIIATLPDQERHALFLRYYADLAQDEIAEVLGIRPGTVAASLSHARGKLRVALQSEVNQ